MVVKYQEKVKSGIYNFCSLDGIGLSLNRRGYVGKVRDNQYYGEGGCANQPSRQAITTLKY
jgi:hypothetical protein